MIGEGVTADGVRWTLSAGGSDQRYGTTLRTEDTDGVIDSGGAVMRPKLESLEVADRRGGREIMATEARMTATVALSASCRAMTPVSGGVGSRRP
jgi:hypothetical protein